MTVRRLTPREIAQVLRGERVDTEVDEMNAAVESEARGYYGRHMDGEIYWHEAPERESCGGGGVIRCYCGGDLCVCGNRGEIECYGCEECVRVENDSPWPDEESER
jgi:hypothetical protein